MKNIKNEMLGNVEGYHCFDIKGDKEYLRLLLVGEEIMIDYQGRDFQFLRRIVSMELAQFAPIPL